MKEPDSKTEKALRWGQYVVQHLDPTPGGLVLITGNRPPVEDPKLEQMADALEQKLEEAGKTNILICTAPNTYAVRDFPSNKMNEVGWYHKSQLSDAERTRLDSSTDS